MELQRKDDAYPFRSEWRSTDAEEGRLGLTSNAFTWKQTTLSLVYLHQLYSFVWMILFLLLPLVQLTTHIVGLTYQGLACAWRSKQQQPLWWAPQSREYVSEGQIHVQIHVIHIAWHVKILYVGSSILCISRTKGRIISFTCFLFLLTKKVYVYSVIHGIFLGLWRMHFWICNWLHMTNMKAGIYPSCQATSSIVCWVKNLRS